ncbi:MAG: VOC family protein [Bdellovibrio sp.]|jgi:hypothetical protein
MSAKLQTLSFNSKRQKDLAAFYQVLGAGMTLKSVKVGSETYQGRLGDLNIVIYCIQNQDKTSSPNLSLCFDVKNLSALLRDLKKVPGVQTIMDEAQMPTGRSAVVLDPDGRSVEFIELWAEQGEET